MGRKMRGWAGVGAVLALTCAASAPSALAYAADRGPTTASAGSNPELAYSTQDETRPVVVKMPHSIRASKFGPALKRASGRSLHVEMAAGELRGGFTLPAGNPEASLADVVNYMRLEFHASDPIITGVSIDPVKAGARVLAVDAGQAIAEDMAAAMSAEPTAAPLPADDAVTVPQEPAMPAAHAQTALMAGQVIPGHFPSNWNAQAVDALDGQRRNTMNWFRWNSAVGSTPAKVPLDWGIEIGLTLFDDLIGGTGSRPKCIAPQRNPTTAFWAQTWEAPNYIWVSNLPAAAAAYPDTWLLSDPCSYNSLELGIGYPRVLKPDVVYFLQSSTLKGNQPEGRSAMSAGAYLRGNDCRGGTNPEAPSTACMGLISTRVPPVTGSQSYVNKSRNLTAPGCYAMVSGWAAPTNSAPGVNGCPTKR